MSARETIARLTTREYLPLGGWLLTWAIVAAAAGPADAARLLAATILVRAAQAFVSLDVGPALRRRLGAPADVFTSSRRLAVRVQLLSLAAAALGVAGLALLWAASGHAEAATAAALIALGLPARPLAALRRRAASPAWFRLGLAWGGVLLVAGAAACEIGLIGLAAAMGLREWLAFALGLARRAPPPQSAAPLPAPEPLTFAEVAGVTIVRARHRLSYRIGKGVLGIVLGPFGSVVARTGRGVGLHRRLIRFMPRTRAAAALLALVAATPAFALLFLVREPVALLASAGLLRIAASAGTVALWWNHADVHAHDEEDDDD